MYKIYLIYYDRFDTWYIMIELMLIRQANQNSLICHYWYFSNKDFKFQTDVCNRCHDLWMSMNLCDIPISNIKSVDYSCIIRKISKSEAIKLMQNIDLTKRRGTLKTSKLLSHIKMVKEILMFGYTEIEKKNIFTTIRLLFLKKM